MRVALVCLVLVACGFPKPQDVGSDDAPAGGGSDAAIQDAPPDAPGPCNVLTQTGCAANQRCTYVNQGSALGEMCEPMGSAAAGSNCSTDPTSGIDNCVAGDVCAGKCKPVCNTQGSASGGCGSGFTCNLYQHGAGTVGACDQMCDPLNDNDFDGPASAHTKTGTVCTAAMQGCYGTPSGDPTRPTTFTCATDINYAGQALHHRSQCTSANGCGPFVNGCNQGYVPLLYDSTGNTTVVCVAFCKPLNCFSGSCGGGNVNAVGAAPHRCNTTDAVGSFTPPPNGDQCAFLWIYELDQTGNHVPSQFSNTLGICFDHSKYMYDSNGDGTPDTQMPPCTSLPDGVGNGTTLGAADLGCVDTTHAGLPAHAPRKIVDLRLMYHRAP